MRSFALVGLLLAHSSQSDVGLCEDFSFADAREAAPRFEQYVSNPERLKAAEPRITAHYRAFRSAIRLGAASGPNFAGHYTFAQWAAGAGGICWAIVDAKNGFIGDGGCVETFGVAGQEPQFRLDSRLLILTSPRGIGYYEWTGAALRELRFIERKELCDRSASKR